jgi:hypothetical protein
MTTTKPKSARRFARDPKTESATPAIAQPDGKDLPLKAPVALTAKAEAAPRPQNKISGVIELLQRSKGATLAEMITATGWLAHTTRAALTGLKKKGKVIERGKRGDVTCYFLVASAA